MKNSQHLNETDLDLDIAELDARLEMITPIGPEPDWWVGGGSGTPVTK